eukprot:TRINITY_DN17252_c2_g1_i1.p1 TRINITY_DN17252_c2_g1~~TRINITY_DN17252_c2_g1_i1.p1  ORF type:complete len:169 (+),score=43.47 TRINITY_DN17252_c2_g1_i1:87-593(+)
MAALGRLFVLLSAALLAASQEAKPSQTDIDRINVLEAKVAKLADLVDAEKQGNDADQVRSARLALGLGVFYGIFIFVGGVIGFVKAGSKASLIAGTICALMVCGACAIGLQGQQKIGLMAESAISLLMAVFFAKKYLDSGKVMPGLILAVLGAATAAFAAINADSLNY